MAKDNSGKVSENPPLNFRNLLEQRKQFFKNIIGSDEFNTIVNGNLDDRDSIDINPEFDSPEDLRDYWEGIIELFFQHDTELAIDRNFSLHNRKEHISNTYFNLERTAGLSVLIVGCYHTDIFNKPDFVNKAETFLDSTNAEDYMLITACNEEVMYAKKEKVKKAKSQYENKFFNLIFNEKYQDRVFPVRLPERPEFHFSGYLVPEVKRTKDGEKLNYDNKKGSVGFETHHFECDEIRTRIDSHCVDCFLLAFRSFAKYVMKNASRCLIDRNAKSYRKYSPEFFYVYRQQPPYLRKRVKIEFKEIFGEQKKGDQ